MNRRFLAGCTLLCLVTLATTTAAQPATVDSEPPLPAWVQLAPAQPAEGAAAAWQGIWLAMAPDRPVPASIAGSGTWSPPFVDLQVPEGEYAGHWRFHGRLDAPPHAAWRLRISDTAPYVVQAQFHCDEAAGDCQTLARELAWLQAPRPPQGAATMDDWLRIITEGPCEPGPVRMGAPRFPPQALREEARGTVQVLIAFDACGKVRYAAVNRSSGSRLLDRAAVDGARGWRVAIPEGMSGPAQGVVPIRFDIEADAPASE